MSILLGNPLLFTGATGPYSVSRSLRFNSADSAYLNRTPASAGNRKTWTWAGWVKRSKLGTAQTIFRGGAGTSNATYVSLYFRNDDTLWFGGWSSNFIRTTAVYRDCSAWYHVVLTVNTTLSSNRIKLYVNGAEQTITQDGGYPAQNDDLGVNQAALHTIGGNDAVGGYSDFYVADCFLIDGQALDPTSFGEFDANGIWQPIAYSGTYGTNGFHLDFSDNSTAAALGTDTSGNGNTWSVNNISVAGSKNYADYLTRFTTGENKYSAFDGSTSTYVSQDLADGTGITFAPSPSISVTSQLRFYHTTGAPSTKEYSINGGSAVTTPNSGWVTTSFTGTLTSFVLRDNRGVGYSAALYAIEVDGTVLVDYRAVTGNDSLVDVPTNGSEVDTGSGGQVRGNYCTLNPLDKGGGASAVNGNLDLSLSSAGSIRSTIGMSSGKWFLEVTVGATSLTVGIAKSGTALSAYLGSQSNEWSYGQNASKITGGSGTSYGVTFTAGDVIGTAFDADNGTLTFYKNGSSQGTAFTGLTSGPYFFAVGDNSATSGHACNFGQRPFAYTAPSGFKALNTASLPAPLVTKPSTVMDVKLWSGNGTSQTITTDFSPDFVWIKCRNTSFSHTLHDTIRGPQLEIYSDSTSQEYPNVNGLTSFNSTGFTVGSQNYYNGSGNTFVGWTWDAGSSTVTNTQGSITSQVRTNNYLSVVTYTGTGANATIGHGLGTAPSFIIVKNRSSATNWRVYHSELGNTKAIFLSTTGTPDTSSVYWNNTSPTSTVFSVGSDDGVNGNGNSMVAYLFSPVAGYSSFGSYTGNGSTDGPFVFCNFRPRWIMVKAYAGTSVQGWNIHDSARGTYNPNEYSLFAEGSGAETSNSIYYLDFLSNGFKARGIDGAINQSGVSYIYAAFAESPFQYARAR